MRIENNRVDFYIGMAVDDSYQSVSDWYQNLDASNVVISKRLDRMVHRTIRRNQFLEQNKRALCVAKRVAVYVMMVMSLLLALVLSVSALRNALWNAAVEWFDDHISIHFEQPSEPDGSTKNPSQNGGTTTPNFPVAPPPPTIEEIRKPRDLPEGIEEDILAETKVKTVIDYYRGDVWLCTFTQNILTNDDVVYDNECEIIEMTINSNLVIVLQYPDGRVIMIWNDGQYRYKLETESLSLEDLAMWVEKVL